MSFDLVISYSDAARTKKELHSNQFNLHRPNGRRPIWLTEVRSNWDAQILLCTRTREYWARGTGSRLVWLMLRGSSDHLYSLPALHSRHWHAWENKTSQLACHGNCYLSVRSKWWLQQMNTWGVESVEVSADRQGVWIQCVHTNTCILPLSVSNSFPLLSLVCLFFLLNII